MGLYRQHCRRQCVIHTMKHEFMTHWVNVPRMHMFWVLLGNGRVRHHFVYFLVIKLTIA